MSNPDISDPLQHFIFVYTSFLKTIIWGSMVPVAVQAKTAVMRRFSDLVVHTLMDFMPLLSMVFVGTVSKKKLVFHPCWQPYNMQSYGICGNSTYSSSQITTVGQYRLLQNSSLSTIHHRDSISILWISILMLSTQLLT